ncbi:hypothetical protein [Liquorilactobacillus hordei]|uniref:hypothetical protein n=1 Tax=Liquorilactobacillus hordei TaxID=468911 RepID=UPI0039EAD89C
MDAAIEEDSAVLAAIDVLSDSDEAILADSEAAIDSLSDLAATLLSDSAFFRDSFFANEAFLANVFVFLFEELLECCFTCEVDASLVDLSASDAPPLATSTNIAVISITSTPSIIFLKLKRELLDFLIIETTKAIKEIRKRKIHVTPIFEISLLGNRLNTIAETISNVI